MNKWVIILLILFTVISCKNQKDYNYDVCVYGGTSAGVIAAYKAAKMGKKTILIEPGKHLGGMTASGLGMTDIGDKNAITGFTMEFYQRIAKHYGEEGQTRLTFEPHVAENIFNELAAEADFDTLLQYRIISASVKNTKIESIQVESSLTQNKASNKIIRARVFIDCSYEGDLMARTGVSYDIGREDNSVYNEKHNGWQMEWNGMHQFMDGIDPYIVPGDSTSGYVYGITPDFKVAEPGTGDKNIQAYNFRVCLTNVDSNKIPITKPPDYDPAMYELLARVVEKKEWEALGWKWKVIDHAPLTISQMPNGKTDINNCGPFSTDFIGENWEYPEASYNRREEIKKAHENYQKGLFYFLGNSERIPERFRKEMLTYGYCKDEFTDNGGWPFQLYVREARRMIGKYVMTEHNWYGEKIVPDGIAIASYGMDSHNTQRVVINGMVKNEGDVQVWEGVQPYPVSYRSIVPKKSECTNLLVPVCLSASHIAYGSIRMEPVFMMTGEAAGAAASIAINDDIAVQDLDYENLQEAVKFNWGTD